MKNIPRLTCFAFLILVTAAFVDARLQLRNLRAAQLTSDARYAELSSNYDALLAKSEATAAEMQRLRDEAREIHILRGKVTELTRAQSRPSAGGPNLSSAASGGLGDTVTSDRSTFAGFSSPENGFRSLMWASARGEYGDWIASLSAEGQEKELAKTDGAQEFLSNQKGPNAVKGMQILDTKRIGDGRTELKVRLDRQSSSVLLIFRMEAVGGEWKLGEDVREYTEGWNLINVPTP